MAKTNVPKKVLDLLAEVGLSTNQAGWDCHGTWVMYHKAAEKLAGYKKVKFDKPEIIHQDVGQKEVVMLVTGHCGDITEWSFGEATPSNNKNAYPYAMAEKRAKDRVILKLLGFHGDVYTDTEIDDQLQQQLKRQAERRTPPKEVRSEVVTNSYSSKQEKSSPPPTETWEQIQEDLKKDIKSISTKMWSIEIRKKERLNELRGAYYKVKEKYQEHEKWQEIHTMFKDAQTELEK